MSTKGFDVSSKDSQAMPITPVEPRDFDFARYEAYARDCDARYAQFMSAKQGIAVWQRVRAGEVFRDACHDMKQSLHLQLGGLTKSLDYLSDAPTYLEPWYGIGTTISAFGGEYEWHEDQAPAVRPLFTSVDDVVDLTPRDFDSVPIMRYTIDTIEYFLQETRGRLPISWTDLQNPLNVATQLVDISTFFTALVEAPDKVKQILAAITDVVISFTKKQSALIGDKLVRPGHGFASSYAGTGIGLSSDNLVMISPRMYESFCLPNDAKIGASFGGTAIHSCGDWARWLPTVKKNPNLVMVDAAFSPQTDPDPNQPEIFRDTLVGTGIVLHARVVGDSEDVLSTAKRFWKPGLKLVVVTYVQDVQEQHKLYQDIHNLCV